MKKSISKKILAALLAAGMSLSLAACGGAPADDKGGEEVAAPTAEKELKADLEYWSSWSETERQAQAMQEAADSFMKANPGVKINFTFNGRDNRKLVGSAIDAGTKITMMDANVDFVQQLWGDYILDLSDAVAQPYSTTNGQPYKDTILPAIMDLSPMMFDGKYMFFPYAPQGTMVFCNKGLLNECGVTEYPATWEELMDACEKIKAKGYIPITCDNAYDIHWVGHYMTRLLGDDATRKLAQDPAAWSDPKVLEAAKAIEEMAKKGYFDPDIESNVYPNAQQNMVISGKVAMYINGTWLPHEVIDTTPEGFQWGAFPFPAVPGGVNGTEGGCYSTFGICLNKNATPEEIEAATAFAVYFTTSFSQRFSDVATIIPIAKDGTWPETLTDAKTVFEGFTKRYPSSTSLGSNTNSRPIIEEACLKLMGGSITAEEFVKSASKF